jgi:hypothetical protein
MELDMNWSVCAIRKRKWKNHNERQKKIFVFYNRRSWTYSSPRISFTTKVRELARRWLRYLHVNGKQEKCEISPTVCTVKTCSRLSGDAICNRIDRAVRCSSSGVDVIKQPKTIQQNKTNEGDANSWTEATQGEKLSVPDGRTALREKCSWKQLYKVT